MFLVFAHKLQKSELSVACRLQNKRTVEHLFLQSMESVRLSWIPAVCCGNATTRTNTITAVAWRFYTGILHSFLVRHRSAVRVRHFRSLHHVWSYVKNHVLVFWNIFSDDDNEEWPLKSDPFTGVASPTWKSWDGRAGSHQIVLASARAHIN